jgi:hypothetical protein
LTDACDESILARTASTNSTGETRFLRIEAASSVAERSVRSERVIGLAAAFVRELRGSNHPSTAIDQERLPRDVTGIVAG